MNRLDRKKQLIAQGAVYRAEAMQAKRHLRDGPQPDALARGALGRAAGAAQTLLRHRGTVQTLLPLLMAGASALTKKGTLPKSLRGTLAVGAVAAAFSFIRRFKKTGRAAADGADAA